MDMSFEDQIRERAYQIWEAGGMADGQAHEHWVSAEQAVRNNVPASVEPEVILTKAAPGKVALGKVAPGKVAAKTVKASAAKPATSKTVKSKAATPKAPRAVKAKKAVEAAAH